MSELLIKIRTFVIEDSDLNMSVKINYFSFTLYIR